MYYHHWLFKGLKKSESKDNLVDSQTPRLGESGSRFLIMNISANLKRKLERLEMQCKGPNRFMHKPQKICLVAMSF
jgi:hypothetical protein